MDDLISRSELTEAIKRQYCTGCDNYNGSRCRACHADDMLSLVDDAAGTQRWISVEERLPEPKEDVALHIRCGDVSFIRTGWRMGNGQFICPNDSLSGYEVTHWMPLPSTEGIK